MTNLREQIRSVVVTFESFAVGAILLIPVSHSLSAVGFSVQNRPALRLGLTTVLLQRVTFGGVVLFYPWTRDVGQEFIRMRVPTRRDIAGLSGDSSRYWSRFAYSRS